MKRWKNSKEGVACYTFLYFQTNPLYDLHTLLQTSDKAIAAVQAGSHCLVTGKPLSDDNVQYDHHASKAANSTNTKINVLSGDGNRLKSDLSEKLNKNIANIFTAK